MQNQFSYISQVWFSSLVTSCLHILVLEERKEGMLYLTTLSTLSWLYGNGDTVKDGSVNERGNPLPQFQGLLF